ncbi:hypothetical protein AAVH_34649, partial [Aphelenchoides avenae]
MSFILDAWRALYDPLAIEWLSGETRNKHSRCMDLRARLKRLPLTDAERKAVEIVDIRSELYTLPLWTVTCAPPLVWLYNHFVHEVQNRFLRMIAGLPCRFILMYYIAAHYAWCYGRAHILDKFFTRDSGIVKLVKKYQRAPAAMEPRVVRTAFSKPRATNSTFNLADSTYFKLSQFCSRFYVLGNLVRYRKAYQFCTLLPSK